MIVDKTSDWSKSDCSVNGRYRQRYLRVRVSLITSSLMWISNRGHVFCVRGIRLHPTAVFSNVLMQKKRYDSRKHLVGQTVIVPYMEDTDSDILGLGLGFLITSSLMWISNHGHVFCVRGIRLHPTGVLSNVLMKKKRHDNRKTSDWSKSDCSVRGRYQQRYLVHYKRYRNEFL